MLNGLDFFEAPKPGRTDRRAEFRSHQDGPLFADMLRAAQSGEQDVDASESGAAAPLPASVPPLHHDQPASQAGEERSGPDAHGPDTGTAAPAATSHTVQSASPGPTAPDAGQPEPAGQTAPQASGEPQSTDSQETRAPESEDEPVSPAAHEKKTVQEQSSEAAGSLQPANAEPTRAAQDAGAAGEASGPDTRRQKTRAASDDAVEDVAKGDGQGPDQTRLAGQASIESAAGTPAAVQTSQASSDGERQKSKDKPAGATGVAAVSPDSVSVDGAQPVQPAASADTADPAGMLSTGADSQAGAITASGAAQGGAALSTPGPVQAAIGSHAANPVLQAQPPAALVAAPNEIVDIVTTRLSGDDRPDRITVQLDPPELGRVSIEFKFDAQGLQQVAVRGETPEAVRQLRLLHFDLVQSLDQQGLNARDMTFSQGFAERGFAGGDNRPGQTFTGTPSANRDEPPAPAPAFVQTSRLPQLIGGSGLNIKL